MAFENRLQAIPQQLFTASGTADGKLTLAEPTLFKVGQIVILSSPSLQLIVKRVESTVLFVGPNDQDPNSRTDVSGYLVGSTIHAIEQLRPYVPTNSPDKLSENIDDREHEEEPTVAKRVVLVDRGGDVIDSVVVSGVRRLAVDEIVNVNVDVTDNIVVSGVITSDVTDRPDRELGIVSVSGVVTVSGITVEVGADVTDRPDRELGIVSVSGLELGSINARNKYDTTLAVAPGNTAAIVLYLADAKFKFRGFHAYGGTDGHYRIKFNAATVYETMTNITQPTASVILPNPDAGAASTVVTLEVTNTGMGVADYKGTILGE